MKLGRPMRRNGLDRATRRPVATLALATLTLMLAACGSAVDVDSIGRGEIRRVAATRPVVLGRLHIRSAGGIAIMPGFPGWYETPRPAATILLVRLPDAGAYLAQVHDNGRFAWRLDPGTYVIENVLGLSRPLSFNYAFCPKTVFRVARPAGIVNLGEISIVTPTDPTERHRTPGYFGPNSCKDPENQISVTQRAGELTRLVQHPLTPVVVAPQLPELWQAGSVKQGEILKARSVLHRLGITIPE